MACRGTSTAASSVGARGRKLASDAFGPPRVQTAWLSGLALGRALVERLAG